MGCNFGSVQEHSYLQLSFFFTSVCLCESTLSASSLGWFIIFNEKKKISSSRKKSSKAPQKKKLLKFVDIVLSGRKMNKKEMTLHLQIHTLAVIIEI